MSGPGFGLEAAALNGRRALRAYFSGQNIAVGAIAVPLLTAVCFGLAAVAKHPMDGFVGMAVGLAGIGAGLALANLFTVAVAYPVEKRGGTPTPRAASGHNGEAVGSQLITLLGVGAAVTPVILAAVFTRTDPAAIWMPVLVLGGAAYGLALAWAGVRGAATSPSRSCRNLPRSPSRATCSRPTLYLGRAEGGEGNSNPWPCSRRGDV